MLIDLSELPESTHVLLLWNATQFTALDNEVKQSTTTS
jgi:hypothetical protein